MHYTMKTDGIYRHEGEKDITGDKLCNFYAQIIAQTKYVHDENDVQTIMHIQGGASEDVFAPLEINAADFTSLSWVVTHWGARAVIFPGGNKDDLRAAIQLLSKPVTTTVYKHTGWINLNKKPHYLHAGGALHEKGNDSSIRVELPAELSHYRFEYDKSAQPKDGIDATLSLRNLGPASIIWPLIAATIAPVYGEVDFGVHVAGRTGTYKSELLSLCQSHYGPNMDARHLPASWSSTANALEAQAFHAKDAVMVVDDFVPNGTSWQRQTYQATADKLLRAQGNLAGRARLTEGSRLKKTMHPRGIILSSGEDVPEGHSIRARLLIIELSPGDIRTAALSAAQAKRRDYQQTIISLVQYLAKNPQDRDGVKERAIHHRDQLLNVGHTRTPSMVGRLIATVEHFLSWATTTGYPANEAEAAFAIAYDAIRDAASNQAAFLESADPIEVFISTIKTVTSALQGHFKTITGGIPKNPTILGWTEEASMGDIPTYRRHGATLGWIDWHAGAMYLDVHAGLAQIRRSAGNELPLTKQTLVKRLRDAQLLLKVDDARKRNTIRITADGQVRQVLALPISKVFEPQELNNGDRD